ncbi:MAG: alpha-amylase [Bacteroidales bacterium]|nr:alpha-amylase [Bacteroidales bacterium]
MRKNRFILFSPLVFCLVLLMLISCQESPKKMNDNQEQTKESSGMKHVEWSRSANIYEVNIRQYTEEGTFKAFRKHLPRLKEMGVDILWLMPIHPVSKLNRKGTLGSYYAVADYKAVNPEFGNMDDFKALVEEAHGLGMKVILDWVANHSGWDNVWTVEHEDFYEKDSNGKFISPYDWTDVISFDYNNPQMRDSMITALKFWITEADIDGYRCDVAGMVPTDFWDDARTAMDKIKPVFMLAEDEDNADLLRHAFDMNYTWKLNHLMNDIAKGKKIANDIWDYLKWNDAHFQPDDYRMAFTTNHDENSWNGTTKERLGDATEVFAVLSYTVKGMPLIYCGQEAGLDKRLAFFEKDTINWDKLSEVDFYTTLNKLKHNNKALWNGTAGGEMLRIGGGVNPNVFAFYRLKQGNIVASFLNLSPGKQSITFDQSQIEGDYTDVFSGKKVSLRKGHKFTLKPWGYLVLTK